MSSPAKFCIDTSALIHAWRRAYPIRNFRPVWDKFDDLIEDERLLSSKEVLLELKKRDDELFDWANDRQQIFMDIESDELPVKWGTC